MAPFVGIPLGGGPPPPEDLIEEGSDMPYGNMLASHEDASPRRPPFFNSKNWQPPD